MARTQSGGSSNRELNVFSLRLAGGVVQPHEPFMRAVEPPSRRAADTRGALYVLISAIGQQSAPYALCQDLLQLVGRAYYAAGGSVTRGLRDAILSANEYLYTYNVRTEEDDRLALGLCCAVICGGDLYIGQMGPAVAVACRQGAHRRYPAYSPWTAMDEPLGSQLNREPPLGLRRDSEPNLYHTEYQSGDSLLLASAHLLRQASDAQLAAAASQSTHERWAGSLAKLAGERNLTALAVIPASRAPATTPAVRQDIVEALPIRPSVGDLLIRPSEPTLRQETVKPEQASVVDGAPYGRADSAHQEEDELSDSDWETPGPANARPQRPRVDLVGAAEVVAQGARRLRRGTEDMMLNVLPTDVPERPLLAEPAAPIPMAGKVLVFVAMIIPFIVLFTVVMARIQYDRARAFQYTHAVQQARFLFDQAVRQEDPQLERQELYRALDAIDLGRSVAPDDPDLGDLRRRAQHRIDQIEGVIPIYSFVRLFLFEDDAVSHTDSSRIVINERDVMVLNRGSDLVYRFILNDVGDALQPVEANPVVIRPGDTFDGITVSDLIDVAWMPAEGSQALARFVVLDRSGTLLSFDPRRGVRAEPVGNADLWQSPQAIGGHFGNLYLLDPLLGRLLKYLPSNNEYVRTPLDYLDPALAIDLTGAVDFGIDAAGNVYILYADGAIRKFLNGAPVDFPMRGFFGNMRSPVAMHVSAARQPEIVGHVYVADTGNRRVLQFTLDGVFVRQFRAVEAEPFMDRLRGIYVDETDRRMFLVSGQHLVMATLPALER